MLSLFSKWENGNSRKSQVTATKSIMNNMALGTMKTFRFMETLTLNNEAKTKT